MLALKMKAEPDALHHAPSFVHMFQFSRQTENKMCMGDQLKGLGAREAFVWHCTTRPPARSACLAMVNVHFGKLKVHATRSCEGGN